MNRPTIFISYSHKDEDQKDRLVTHLGVLHKQGLLDLWDDRHISAGADWYQEIQEAMTAASVAVLLVSAHFLTSPFILSEEVPRLLERRDKEGLRIFPVIVKPCAWQQVKWLARMQVRPKDGHPLSVGDEHQIDADLAAVAEEVAAIISPAPHVSGRPTASELRRFLDEDFPRLEDALHDVWVSVSGRSSLTKYSATSNWNTLTSRLPDIPEDIRVIFDKIVKTRELAWGGTSKLTGEQLSSTKRGINQILKFLRQRFPAAGVDLPSAGMQTATTEAVSERAPDEHQVDFAIITALKREAKAVVSRLENYSGKRFEDRDIRTYRCETIPIQDTDRAYRVVVMLLPSMGEISATIAATDAITLWNPNFVLMVGIAGGIPQDDLDLGDVVVADQVAGYEYGKVTDHESKPYEIKPRDRVYPASALLLDRVHNFWDQSWTQQVNVPRPDNAPARYQSSLSDPLHPGTRSLLRLSSANNSQHVGPN